MTIHISALVYAWQQKAPEAFWCGMSHGRFSEQSAKCLKCGARWKRHEDETDVHFSLSFLEDAIDNVFDRAIIISADSDHVPAVRRVRARLPGVFPADIDKAAASGAPAPSVSPADEKVAYESVQFVYQKGIAYGYQMGLRPQTLYGIAIPRRPGGLFP